MGVTSIGINVFVQQEREFEPLHVWLDFPDDNKPSHNGPFRTYDLDGNEITLDMMRNTFHQALPQDPDQMASGEDVTALVQFHQPLVAVDEQGNRYQSISGSCSLTYRWKMKYMPFQLHSYTGDGVNYEVVTAEAVIGDVKGKFMLTRTPDMRVGFGFVPDVLPAGSEGKPVKRFLMDEDTRLVSQAEYEAMSKDGEGE